MSLSFRPLCHTALTRGTTLLQAQQSFPGPLNTNSPALTVMTDLQRVMAFSIEPIASIDAANDKMIACGVRLLFVTDNQGGILGIITATDILGEKPMSYLKERGGTHEDITVQDIMTTWEHLEVLPIDQVRHAHVGGIITTLEQTGRQHLLVVEHDTDTGQARIRGLFSSTQIGRLLGIEIELPYRATTFAELGQALAATF